MVIAVWHKSPFFVEHFPSNPLNVLACDDGCGLKWSTQNQFSLKNVLKYCNA